MFISGYANTENVFYCLIVSHKTAEVMDYKRTLILTLRSYSLSKMERLELNLKMPKTAGKELCQKKKARTISLPPKNNKIVKSSKDGH